MNRRAWQSWLASGAVLVSAVQISPAQSQSDTVYRWVDAQGQAHYSDHPPADAPAQVVKPSPLPPSGDDSAQRLKDFVERSDAETAAKEREARKTREAQAAAEARHQACERARANRERVGSRPRILQIEPDGSARRLTEEERQAQLAELDKIVAECAPR